MLTRIALTLSVAALAVACSIPYGGYGRGYGGYSGGGGGGGGSTAVVPSNPETIQPVTNVVPTTNVQSQIRVLPTDFQDCSYEGGYGGYGDYSGYGGYGGGYGGYGSRGYNWGMGY